MTCQDYDQHPLTPSSLCLAPHPPPITGVDRQEWPWMTTKSSAENHMQDENTGFRSVKFKPKHSQTLASTFSH